MGEIYVYGVVRASRVPVSGAAGGVGSPPAAVRLLAEGPVAAVISEAPPGLRARRRDLLAHQTVLGEMGRGGPVLPMRFATVASDESTVRSTLTANAERYVAALDRVTDRVEMNVKVGPAQDRLAELLRQEPHLQRLRRVARAQPGYENDVRLGEAVATALEQRAGQAADVVVRALAEVAAEAVAGPVTEGCVRNVSFLVDEDGLPAFRATAGKLAAGLFDRMELRLTGPLPCYSFVPADQDEARAGTTARGTKASSWA
ncbi:GvpL/GvpF family gas vesicle protein [Streptomyces tsukubensis]|uniref:Gas vesicle protein n=1 Tax=Streptomyces tsukubensis TaxID=83656 RepID=A0A1V4AG76_9ACTN|nr:GvpL/GvpF family gas vesicle protein [Streptomyces tsukubensis]OON82665.1 hypothetical protein B1H18_00965 [Streptomyces tsukubensis]QFR92166.1 gas vesicle protein [Streptomyces tsukubensis]